MVLIQLLILMWEQWLLIPVMKVTFCSELLERVYPEGYGLAWFLCANVRKIFLGSAHALQPHFDKLYRMLWDVVVFVRSSVHFYASVSVNVHMQVTCKQTNFLQCASWLLFKINNYSHHSTTCVCMLSARITQSLSIHNSFIQGYVQHCLPFQTELLHIVIGWLISMWEHWLYIPVILGSFGSDLRVNCA